ncbi:tagatose-1,6-bisphosphate aldolase non-catalytic subunit AgaZ/GatZ [Paenibacillus sp. RC73]|uniref:class II D-tagatose-bisphosphate aldolase non-catalytic subunit n=1 Tax=Paenibacillus sp. RC73 TaxID=3156250 RepID=UPI003834D9DE
MTKPSINQVVTTVLNLREKGEPITLLGIGPMSYNLIKASLELGKEKSFPLMFIASRNQVDARELGGGYVCNWDQKSFVAAISEVAEEVGFDGLYYICRDHGGPWQRDNERNEHLEVDEAMKFGKQSYLEDIVSGFDLLHIDPTKDPYVMGKVVPMDFVLTRTVELIAYCEEERLKRGLPEIGYEVGTEETNGGLTSTDSYTAFIKQLNQILKEKGLPKPIFIVGQTGTLVKKTENVGTFNSSIALKLADAAKELGVGLKEHNGDYIADDILLLHQATGITATNVAPQFGTEETRAYLELAKVEEQLLSDGVISAKSNIGQVLAQEAIQCRRWQKWMTNNEGDLSNEEIISNEQLTRQILDIAGHYTFNNESVKQEIGLLIDNLKKGHIDGERFVINRIKRSLNVYVEGFNLEESTAKIMNELSAFA